MRSLLVILTLPLALGCRAPAIPSQLSEREYVIYSAWLDQAGAEMPHPLSFAVDSVALTPQQNELQFRQCLPPRMETIFDTTSESTLSLSPGSDWLSLSDGRSAQIHPHDAPLAFPAPTEFVRFSRVAFTRFGYEAYLWVEHRTCAANGQTGCQNASGALVHGKKSNGAWSFEDTTCQAIGIGQ